MKLSWVHSISSPVEPSRLEIPRAIRAKPSPGITGWRMHVWFDPSGFIKSVLDVSSRWVPQCPCPVLSTEVDLSSIWRRATSPITTPCRQPHLVSSITVVLGCSGDSLYYSIKWVESKNGVTWELIRVLGYSGSSFPSCPSLSLDNLFYREDFPQSTHGVGMTFVQTG